MIHTTAYERIIDALRDHGAIIKERGDDGAQAQCPAHDDRNPSLSIGPRRDRKGIVITCHAGCDTADILQTLNLTMVDLFDDDGLRDAYSPNKSYRYSDGHTNKRIATDKGKTFVQDDVTDQKSLYGVEHIGDANTVYANEGEKAADAIRSIGAAAVATGGAERKCDLKPLQGRNIILVVDRDNAGDKWMRRMKKELAGIAKSITPMQSKVETEKADAADHIAAGYSLDELIPYDPADPDPIPLTGQMANIPAFPVDAFPHVYGKKIVELAEFTQTDPAMAGVSALDALAACAGGHAEIQVRPGWSEPLCIFTAIIAAPGERKSPVQNAMI
jgi:hypothetical protein